MSEFFIDRNKIPQPLSNGALYVRVVSPTSFFFQDEIKSNSHALGTNGDKAELSLYFRFYNYIITPLSLCVNLSVTTKRSDKTLFWVLTWADFVRVPTHPRPARLDQTRTDPSRPNLTRRRKLITFQHSRYLFFISAQNFEPYAQYNI